jgi:hypothetical protein
MTDQLLTMRAAVAGLVPDGARVACGLALEAAWVGNVTTGSGYCFRRAVEAGQPRPLTVREHSNRRGNAQAWGNLGISQEAIVAAGTVIVVAEELVDTEVIRSRPHDADAYRDYARASATPEGFQAWLDRWVLGVADRAGYLEALGASGAGGRG